MLVKVVRGVSFDIRIAQERCFSSLLNLLRPAPSLLRDEASGLSLTVSLRAVVPSMKATESTVSSSFSSGAGAEPALPLLTPFGSELLRSPFVFCKGSEGRLPG